MIEWRRRMEICNLHSLLYTAGESTLTLNLHELLEAASTLTTVETKTKLAFRGGNAFGSR
jgi:hypothetical protein